MAQQTISQADVRRLLGPVDDHKVAAILATGASIAELERAAAYLALETDVMGELEKPLTGRAALIYELVRRDEVEPDEGR